MHEISCSEPVCWLRDFCKHSAPTLPAPKFCIGQQVQVIWHDENTGKEKCDRGYIIGIQVEPPGWQHPGWWYTVVLTELTEQPWLSPGYVDTVHESDVRST